MATRIAWLLNFEAIDELAGVVQAALTIDRRREIAALFHDLIAPEDVLLDDSPPLASTTDLVAQAFCPTPSARSRIEALGLVAPTAPSWDVLRRVSDRGFCAALGHGLPQAAYVHDMHALLEHVRTPSWTKTHVIKRAYSFAGREQRRVHAGILDDSTRGFCERSFSRGEGVQVEPWVERLLDVSLHGYLHAGGEIAVGEPRGQRCEPMGRFLGMQTEAPALRAEEANALRHELRRAGDALRAAGYFGPFGIDAFRYRGPDGADAFNPRCEINARFTMGYPRELLLRGLRAL